MKSTGQFNFSSVWLRWSTDDRKKLLWNSTETRLNEKTGKEVGHCASKTSIIDRSEFSMQIMCIVFIFLPVNFSPTIRADHWFIKLVDFPHDPLQFHPGWGGLWITK